MSDTVLTEEQVRDRMIDAASRSWVWVRRPYGDRHKIGLWLNTTTGSPYRRQPAPLRIVGVRFDGSHYREVE